MQDGKVIHSPTSELDGKQYDSVTDEYWSAEATACADDHARAVQNGGLKKMGDDMDRGMVLVLSLWDDAATQMQWLDSAFPADQSGQPGFHRGPCAVDSGSPDDLVKNHADATAKYSNIKFGEIGSTSEGAGSGPAPAPMPAPACPGGSLGSCATSGAVAGPPGTKRGPTGQ